MKIKYLSLFVLLFVTACSSQSDKLIRQTVKITNLEENSGGSGSIVDVSDTKSSVLTNAHVCNVAARGGYVHDFKNHKFFITGFKISKNHDLCLITVSGNLKYPAQLASLPPIPLEPATVVGHPRLLPTIISQGHFAGKQTIQVAIGSRVCTEDEKNDPGLGIICLLLGELPIIKTYEAVLVSSLIQPGSSGSAIYNSFGHVSAVVFAGSGEMSYGFAVPYEYVYDFLRNEVKLLDEEVPNLTADLSKLITSRRALVNFLNRLKAVCENIKDKPEVIEICKKWLKK